MSKKYEQLAIDIVDNIGGIENVDSYHHCQTRLRFRLVDNSLADKDVVSAIDGVLNVLISGGMFQVVIGMHVAEVSEEVETYLATATTGPAIEPIEPTTMDKGSDNESDGKNNTFDKITDFVSSIFSPIIPALAGAGMVKAVLAILSTFNLVDTASDTYVIINMIGDATFAFLPILLAFSIAQKLKTNPFLAAVVAGMMVHSTWISLVAAGEAVTLFGFIPLNLVRYTGSVFPIILVILVQAPFEKWLNKVIPQSLRLIFVPLVLFLVMGVLALSIIGPAGDYIGLAVTGAFTWLSENASWAPPIVLGGLYSLLVIFGLHHGLAPIGMIQLTQMGYDSLFGPGVLLANVGQGTAALVVGLMSKDTKTKQLATSGGITGLMGITEPALYGVNVPKVYPLIAGLIGGASGGIVAGITGVRRFATGSSGIPAVVMYIGDGTMQFFYQILIAIAVTVSISAVLTFILFKRFETKDSVKEDRPKEKDLNTNQNAETVNV